MDIVFFQRSQIFEGMSAEEIKSTLDYLNVFKRSYEKHDLVLRSGSPTKFLGLIEKGSVIVERNDFWGNRTVITSFSENEYFAEAYALNPRAVVPVDIVANSNSSIIFLEIANVYNMADSSARNKLLSNLLKISVGKNMYLSNRTFLLSSKSVRDKILAYLNNVRLQKGTNEFDIPFDRQQLADFLNIERTALSKELSRMKSEGLIEYRKNHFILLSTEDM